MIWVASPLLHRAYEQRPPMETFANDCVTPLIQDVPANRTTSAATWVIGSRASAARIHRARPSSRRRDRLLRSGDRPSASYNLQYAETTLGPQTRFKSMSCQSAARGSRHGAAAELSEGERARFLAERLATLHRFTSRMTKSNRGLRPELVRKIKASRSPAVPPPIPPARPQLVLPRGDTRRSSHARGNREGHRDDLEKVAKPIIEQLNPPTQSSRHVISRRDRSPTAEMPPQVSRA